MTYQILRRVTGKDGRGAEAEPRRRGRGRKQLQSALKTFPTTIFYLSTYQQVPFPPHHELIQVTSHKFPPQGHRPRAKCQHHQHHHCHQIRRSSFHLQSLLVFVLEHEVRNLLGTFFGPISLSARTFRNLLTLCDIFDCTDRFSGTPCFLFFLRPLEHTLAIYYKYPFNGIVNAAFVCGFNQFFPTRVSFPPHCAHSQCTMCIAHGLRKV